MSQGIAQSTQASHNSATLLQDSMGGEGMLESEDSSSTPGSCSQSESNSEMSPVSDSTSTSKSTNKTADPGGHGTGMSSSPSSATPPLTPSGTNSNSPLSRFLSSRIKDTPNPSNRSANLVSIKTNLAPASVNKPEIGNLYSFGHGGQRSPSFASSMFPLTDFRMPQNLENMPLSSCVKLMNLDIPPTTLPPNYHNIHVTTATSSTSNHSHPLLNSSSTAFNQQSGHVTSGASHMTGSHSIMPAINEYRSPLRAGLSMTQTSAFFIHPNSSPGGILALHDSHSNPSPGLIEDMRPPSFSPGLCRGPGSTSATIGSAMNPFTPQTAANASTPPSQQIAQQGAPLHGQRLGKRTHGLTESSTSGADSDFSANIMRDTLFPPDSICGNSGGREREMDIKTSQRHNLTGLPGNTGKSPQQLKWQAHMFDSWVGLCDGALQDIAQLSFEVETDKGFNFSVVDNAFVCQKKNHFQVTVTIFFPTVPKFVKLKDGSIKPIESFSLHLHGVKFEQISCEIKLEQSKTDRKKVNFEPETIEVLSTQGEPIKRTISRLHFSETTQNNMRKRGKPNPDQKYFSLVVALHTNIEEGSFPVVAHVSERIIVRASNPGNFDNDCDYTWFKSFNPDYIYHQGRVGINTDKPEEALSVHGNIQVTGQILQGSDVRIKKNVKKTQSHQNIHLENISQLQLYEYELEAIATTHSCRNSNSEDCCSPGAELQSYDRSTSDSDCQRKPGVGNKSTAMDSLTDDGENSECRLRDERNQRRGRDGTEFKIEKKIVGLLAQEVIEVLPNAVVKTEQQMELANGSKVDKLLVVDKDQVLMETLGAVQELHKVTKNHDERIRGCEHDNRSLTVRRIMGEQAKWNVTIKKESKKPLLRQCVGVTIHVEASVLHWLIMFLILLLFSFILNLLN